MRASHLISAIITTGMLALTSTAIAGSGSYGTSGSQANSVRTFSTFSSQLAGGNAGSYTTSSYGSHSVPAQANCPAGSNRGVDGLCMSNSSGGHFGNTHSVSQSTVSWTPKQNYSNTQQLSASEASYRYGSGSISSSYSDSSARVVPFQTTVSSISKYRVPGMGADERLCPTQCPVSVHNPEGGKVLGCYAVCKPVAAPVPQPVYRPVYRPRPVHVVRPVIYVHYPVPVMVQAPVQTCGAGVYYTRYGENWPGRPCGW